MFLFLLCGMLFAASCTKKVKPVNDTTNIACGTTGTLTWELGFDGTLTISGKGEMPNYERLYDDVSSVSSSPWSIYSDSITNLIIEDGVTSIGDWAFYGLSYNIASINLPNSVTNIGEYAFFSHGLSSVTFGNSVITIGKGAFIHESRGLSEIIIYQKNPPKLGGNVFGFSTCYTGIKLYVPAGSVEAYRTTTGWESFLIIGAIGAPSPVIAAGTQMSFMYATCHFSWMLYNDGTAIINGHSMPDYDCMKCPIPWYDQYRNAITAVIIENGMVNISAHAFYQCSSINSISIPSSVIEISNDTPFAGCRNIKKIINHRIDPQIISNNVFADVNKSECVLYVPAGSDGAYRTTEGWKDFINIKPIQ